MWYMFIVKDWNYSKPYTQNMKVSLNLLEVNLLQYAQKVFLDPASTQTARTPVGPTLHWVTWEGCTKETTASQQGQGLTSALQAGSAAVHTAVWVMFFLPHLSQVINSFGARRWDLCGTDVRMKFWHKIICNKGASISGNDSMGRTSKVSTRDMLRLINH